MLYIEDLDGLIALVQASVLEIHPWGSKISKVEAPDRITFDLDPGENVPWTALIDAANEVRERLRAMRLESFVKTTGGKGLHVVVPLTPKADWDTVKAFAEGLAEAMANDTPGKYTATISKRARGGKIYIDYLRNGRGATAVAAYSARARAGAPVPVLTRGHLQHLHRFPSPRLIPHAPAVSRRGVAMRPVWRPEVGQRRFRRGPPLTT